MLRAKSAPAGMVRLNTMYYVYLLRLCDNSLYCGQTQSLEKRLQEHIKSASRGSKYVRSRLPAKLVYSESHPTLKSACVREREIKSWKKIKKEKLIQTHR